MDSFQRSRKWRQLHDTAAAFNRAQLHCDGAALKQLLADEFTYVSSAGVLGGKEMFVQVFDDPSLQLDPFEVANLRIIPLSTSAAVVSGTTTFTGTNRAGPFVQSFRYSDIFVRQKREWRAAFVQVTPLSCTTKDQDSG